MAAATPPKKLGLMSRYPRLKKRAWKDYHESFLNPGYCLPNPAFSRHIIRWTFFLKTEYPSQASEEGQLAS
jgi:hypothetical protein